MTEPERKRLLTDYSTGRISAVALRRSLGNVSYGDILLGLAEYRLPLPRASESGREQRIALARAWLFPKAA